MFDKFKQHFKKSSPAPLDNGQTTYDGACLHINGECLRVDEKKARELQIILEDYFIHKRSDEQTKAYNHGDIFRIVVRNGPDEGFVELELTLEDALRYVYTGITNGYFKIEDTLIQKPDGRGISGDNLASHIREMYPNG